MSKKLTGINPKKEADKKAFLNASETHDSTLDPNAKPTRSFTVPLNDYEIELLKSIAEQQDRSMRKVSRRLLVAALLKEAE